MMKLRRKRISRIRLIDVPGYDKEVAGIVGMWPSHNLKQRQAAIDRLRAKGPDALITMRAMACQEMRLRQTTHRKSKLLYCLLLFICWAPLYRIGYMHHVYDLSIALLLAIVGPSIIGVMIFSSASDEIPKSTTNSISAAIALDVPESAVLLAEVVSLSVSKPQIEAIEDALFKLLPRVDVNSATAFTREARSGLYTLLTGDRASKCGADLRQAICNAMPLIGDSNAIYHLERVIAKDKDPLVREAAAAALPVLRERLAQESAAASLLRPSTTAVDNALLRPASTGAPGEQENLLRPTANDESR